MTVLLHNNIDEPSVCHPLMQVHRTEHQTDCIIERIWASCLILAAWEKSNLLHLPLSDCFPPSCISIFLTRKKLPQLVIITTLQICNCYSLGVLIDSDTPFCSAKILSEYQVHYQLWNLTSTAYAQTPTFYSGHVLILMETVISGAKQTK